MTLSAEEKQLEEALVQAIRRGDHTRRELTLPVVEALATFADTQRAAGTPLDAAAQLVRRVVAQAERGSAGREAGELLSSLDLETRPRSAFAWRAITWFIATYTRDP